MEREALHAESLANLCPPRVLGVTVRTVVPHQVSEVHQPLAGRSLNVV